MKLSEYIEKFGDGTLVDIYDKERIEQLSGVGKVNYLAIVDNKGERTMKTIEELRDYLLDNYVDEDGDLMLDDLDFSEFDGDVYISGMKVQGDLFQELQEVQGDLLQGLQEVDGDLYQSNQEVQGNLFQGNQEVQGNLFQGFQEVQGDYYCSDVKVKGNIFANEPTRLLQEITLEELTELGYKLKENK